MSKVTLDIIQVCLAAFILVVAAVMFVLSVSLLIEDINALKK